MNTLENQAEGLPDDYQKPTEGQVEVPNETGNQQVVDREQQQIDFLIEQNKRQKKETVQTLTNAIINYAHKDGYDRDSLKIISTEQNAEIRVLENNIQKYAAIIDQQKQNVMENRQKVKRSSPIINRLLGRNIPDEKSRLRQFRKQEGYNGKYLFRKWRFCVNPASNVNYISYCDQQYSSKTATEVLTCKENMCVNCCNNYQQILVYNLNKELPKKILQMWNGDVVKSFNQNFQQIAQCTVACEDAYLYDFSRDRFKVSIDGAWQEQKDYRHEMKEKKQEEQRKFREELLRDNLGQRFKQTQTKKFNQKKVRLQKKQTKNKIIHSDK